MRRRSSRRNLPPFLRVEHRLHDSHVWASLSGSAVKVYVCLRRCENGLNANEIKCSYGYMQKKGIKSTASVRAGLKELEEKGLIEIISYGGLMKQPNEYKLSDRWREEENR